MREIKEKHKLEVDTIKKELISQNEFVTGQLNDKIAECKILRQQ
jgi:hypothetical protein